MPIYRFLSSSLGILRYRSPAHFPLRSKKIGCTSAASRVEDFNIFAMRLTKQLFALLVVGYLSCAETVSTSTDREQIWLVSTARIDETFVHPTSLCLRRR